MQVPPPARESPAVDSSAVPMEGMNVGKALGGSNSSSSSSSSGQAAMQGSADGADADEEDGLNWDPDSAETGEAAAGKSAAGASGTVVEQSVYEYSSGMPQGTRQKLLRLAAAGFAACPVLVCTDAAARGLDMPKLDAVIQYDPPAAAQAYVHRVGRTARARRAGEALTLCSATEMRRFLGGRAMAGEYVLLSTVGRSADGAAMDVEKAEEAAAEAADRAAGSSAKEQETAGAAAADARRAVRMARRAREQDEAIARGAKPMLRIDASPRAWESLVPAYEQGLRSLRPLVEAEEGGRVRAWDAPPLDLLTGSGASTDAVASASSLWTSHRGEMDAVLSAVHNGSADFEEEGVASAGESDGDEAESAGALLQGIGPAAGRTVSQDPAVEPSDGPRGKK